MLTRRYFSLAGATALGGLALSACTNGSIDPNAVLAALKTACGIAVPAATILQIFNLDPTQSVSAIVNLICSGYQQTQAAAGQKGRKLAAGESVHFVVEVNGHEVDVTATPAT